MERVHAGTEAAPTAHPVVGLWSWDLAHMNPRGARSFAIFHADGTFVDANPFLCTGVGLWQATGERTADLLIYYHDARTDAGSNLLNVVIAGTGRSERRGAGPDPVVHLRGQGARWRGRGFGRPN
jgi:hypothetical protein